MFLILFISTEAGIGMYINEITNDSVEIDLMLQFGFNNPFKFDKNSGYFPFQIPFGKCNIGQQTKLRYMSGRSILIVLISDFQI